MLSFKEYIEEAKSVGVVYHFTKPEFLEMLLDKTKQRTNIGVEKEFVLWAERGLSLTRNKRLPQMPIANNHFGLRNGYIIRIKIDGNKLSNHYQIKPVAGLEYNQNDPKEVLDVKNKNRTPRKFGEDEEFVLPKNGLVDVKDSIIEVDIFKSSVMPIEWYDDIKNKLQEIGISCNLVRSFN